MILVERTQSARHRGRVAHLTNSYSKLAAAHFWLRSAEIFLDPVMARCDQDVSAAYSRAAMEYRLQLVWGIGK